MATQISKRRQKGNFCCSAGEGIRTSMFKPYFPRVRPVVFIIRSERFKRDKSRIPATKLTMSWLIFGYEIAMISAPKLHYSVYLNVNGNLSRATMTLSQDDVQTLGLVIKGADEDLPPCQRETSAVTRFFYAQIAVDCFLL